MAYTIISVLVLDVQLITRVCLTPPHAPFCSRRQIDQGNCLENEASGSSNQARKNCL